MDVYKEQLVKKITTSKDDARKFALIAAGISVSALILMFTLPTTFAVIGMFLVAGIIYGEFYIIKGMSTEYEYLFTNGELDIDKISGQRSRKRLTNVKISTATAFGQLTEDFEFDDDHTIILASSGLENDEWYIQFNHKDYGPSYLVFSPNEEMLELVRGSLPRALRK